MLLDSTVRDPKEGKRLHRCEQSTGWASHSVKSLVREERRLGSIGRLAALHTAVREQTRTERARNLMMIPIKHHPST
jgi:hypothetical protein